jgi:transposase
MPWKERSIVEERMRFVLRLQDGESMASLCREFGISRVTGYKIFDRYKECGLEGLTDRARTPYHYANKLPRSDRSNDCRLAAREAHVGRSQAS